MFYAGDIQYGMVASFIVTSLASMDSNGVGPMLVSARFWHKNTVCTPDADQ